MNREFVSKIIMAKKLEYEAFRELLPENVNSNIDEFGDFIKESLMECVKEMYFKDKNDEKQEKDEQKEVHKIIIE